MQRTKCTHSQCEIPRYANQGELYVLVSSEKKHHEGQEWYVKSIFTQHRMAEYDKKTSSSED